MHAFDRQTDGQTDRNLIVKTALHSMQRGKNGPALGPAPVRVNKKPAGPKPRTGPVRSLVMAVTLHFFTEFGKPALQKTICGGIYARVYCIFSACTMSS